MTPLALGVALGGTVALFLLDLALSVMTLSASALSRVALRRMNAESGYRLPFLDEFKTVPSSHRAAIHTLRQLSLIGAVGLSGWIVATSGWPGGWWGGIGVGAVVGTLVIETVLARAVALQDPRLALRLTAILVRPVHALTYPVLAPVHAAFRRWAGTIAEEEESEEDADEDVEAFIEVGEREGILEKSEGRMVRGIVDLDSTLVREIMTPRVDVVALHAKASVAEARRVALEAGHSRFPVYGETIDSVVGILHVRDLLRAWEEGWGDTGIGGLVRPAVFVPETRTVAEVLAEMRTRAHVALVVDEYGGFAGMVTLEDVNAAARRVRSDRRELASRSSRPSTRVRPSTFRARSTRTRSPAGATKWRLRGCCCANISGAPTNTVTARQICPAHAASSFIAEAPCSKAPVGP
jgi:CBS domain containing-hemolysin-like protein